MNEPASSLPKPHKPWYRRFAKIVFLLIIAAIALYFIWYFIYYLWSVKQGTIKDIGQEFVPLFTAIAPANTQAAVTDIRPFIRPHNPVRGNQQAPLTLVFFIDFECPFCQQAHPTFTNVMEQYGPAAKIVFKHFPVEALHPNAMNAAMASACAQEQKKFWEYYSVLFEKKKFDTESLLSYAQTLKLNATQFETCLKSEKYRANILQDMEDGLSLGVRGTPTYFMNTIKLEGVQEEEVWNTELLKQLQ